MTTDTAPTQESDVLFAASVAASAGVVLLETRTAAVASATTATDLRDRGDRVAQQHIAQRLAAERPGDPVLSEEAADTSNRLAGSRAWIVDPLDGTREYSEGRSDWAVHVALWKDGELALGAVSVPSESITYSSGTVTGLPEKRPGPLRIAVSRSRPPEIVNEVAAALDAELIPMGSAGVKIISVVNGTVDAYIHAGGQYEWDSAAPVAIARAAGAFTSRLDGSPLRYNRPDPYLPDLIVCRPEYADRVLDAVAATRSRELDD